MSVSVCEFVVLRVSDSDFRRGAGNRYLSIRLQSQGLNIYSTFAVLSVVQGTEYRTPHTELTRSAFMIYLFFHTAD